jgi:aminoglycoside 3-N-acetyltransferase
MLPKAAMSSSGKVSPDDLSEGFACLGLQDGDSVMLHASLESMGTVDGGAAMVLHRLTRAIGKNGTLLMPTFTSVTRHATAHSDFTLEGCWCEEWESRHIPFIPELQPDKEIGAIAHRLCSWPSSRRSKYPAYSYVAVGNHGDEMVRETDLKDPLLPARKLLKHNPRVLTVGVGLPTVTAIHLAEEKMLSSKFVKERALAMSSKGQMWVDIRSIGCSNGFEKLRPVIGPAVDLRQTTIGRAKVESYSMKDLVESARAILKGDPNGLSCGNSSCLSCHR